MTNGKIDKLGNLIRSSADNIPVETLNELQFYRISHKDSIARVFNLLCKYSMKVNRNAIVTYRIKRIQSIVSKLVRFPKMRFSRMWDVGGCRCILNNNAEIYNLLSTIENSEELEIKKIYDYIKIPQEDGYRSLHVFVKLLDSQTTIELQLRNKIDHSWATLVEISDVLFDSQLKEFGKDKILLEFHYLLSLKDGLKQAERIRIANIIRQYCYFEKLSEVFDRNYLEVRKQWLIISKKQDDKYFLIETSKDKVPRITAYSNFESAEIEYFKIYNDKKTDNVVLTHLPKPSYEQISIAYSNYLLTFHSFLNDIYELYENLILDSLDKGNYIRFFKYHSHYHDMSITYLKNILEELEELTNFNTPHLSFSQLNKKKKAWIKDFKSLMDSRGEKNGKFNKLIRQRSKNNFILKRIILFHSNKTTLKIKRMIESSNLKFKK